MTIKNKTSGIEEQLRNSSKYNTSKITKEDIDSLLKSLNDNIKRKLDNERKIKDFNIKDEE